MIPFYQLSLELRVLEFGVFFIILFALVGLVLFKNWNRIYTGGQMTKKQFEKRIIIIIAIAITMIVILLAYIILVHLTKSLEWSAEILATIILTVCFLGKKRFA